MSDWVLSETSSTPAAAAAAAAKTSASSASIIVTRAGLVDSKSAPLQIFAIKPRNRGLTFGTFGHLHKSKSPRIAGELVFDDFDR